VTLQPTYLCRIPIGAVHRLDNACPDLHWQLIKRLKGSLHAADEWLTELSTGSARARLARLLVSLMGEADECEIFSRENLGAMLGVTTETASRAMAEFKREGLVTEMELYRCRCVVGALREIANE
jgi:CRP-like cAMP-binding protein